MKLRKDLILKTILNEQIFQRFIVLSRSHGPGTITRVLDNDGKRLGTKVRVT